MIENDRSGPENAPLDPLKKAQEYLEALGPRIERLPISEERHILNELYRICRELARAQVQQGS